MKEAKQEELVNYRVENQIAVISLNRPRRLNAFSDEMVSALSKTLYKFDIDDDANVADMVAQLLLQLPNHIVFPGHCMEKV